VVLRIKNIFVGSEVLTEAIMNTYTRIFWDITPRNPLKMNFKKKTGSQKLSFDCCLLCAGFWLASLFNAEDGDSTFLRNVG
jgi:hypothetical protein